MKKIVCLSLLLLAAFLAALPVWAADDIAIYIDGERLATDVAPEIAGGVTFVPVRVVSEELGADVRWADGRVYISGYMPEAIMVLEPGRAAATLYYTDNAAEAVPAPTGDSRGRRQLLPAPYIELPLLAAPHVKNGRVMLPLRFVAENMGCEVSYAAGNITISAPGDPAELARPGVPAETAQGWKYATSYTSVGMGWDLYGYNDIQTVAKLRELLQTGQGREVPEPQTPYGPLFEIWDYYIEWYTIGFYNEQPVYEEKRQAPTNTLAEFVLYEMPEGEPEFGDDSRYLIFDKKAEKWYVFAEELWDELLELLKDPGRTLMYGERV